MSEHHNELIHTPLGDLQFSLTDEHGLPLNNSYRITMFPIHPVLPLGMSVEEVTAVLLSLQPTQELHNLTFSCSWRTPLPVAGDPESGECLDAQSWQYGGHIVMVGTEDFDVLSSRLGGCGFVESDYPVHYLPQGINVKVPKVEAGAHVGLHFIVACNRYPEPVEYSAWYAVDIDHAKLLNWEQQAGSA